MRELRKEGRVRLNNILKIKLRDRTVFCTTIMVTGLLEEVELMCWVEVSVVVVVVVVVVGKLPLELVEVAEIPPVQPIIQKKDGYPQF